MTSHFRRMNSNSIWVCVFAYIYLFARKWFDHDGTRQIRRATPRTVTSFSSSVGRSVGIVGRTRVIVRVLLHDYIDGRWRGEGRTEQAELLKDGDEDEDEVGGREDLRMLPAVVRRHCVFELRILRTNWLSSCRLAPSLFLFLSLSLSLSRGPKLFRFHRFFLFVFLMPSSLPRSVTDHPSVRPSLRPTIHRPPESGFSTPTSSSFSPLPNS